MISYRYKLIKTLILACLVLGGIFLVNQTNTTSIISQTIVVPEFQEPVLTALTPHDAIEISSNADPDLLSLAGDGSSGNPYVIEDLEINVTNNTGISIHDTTHHFIIRNCYVSADQYGISVYTRNNATTTIEDCTVTGNFYCGIYVHDEAYTHLENNTIYNNWGYGIYINDAVLTEIDTNKIYLTNNNPIYIYNTYGAEISYNELWSNYRDNIYVRLSDDVAVFNNSIYDCLNVDGIVLEFCSNADVFNNYIHDVSFGIYIEDSNNAYVFQNEIHDVDFRGIYASRCLNSNFSTNIISRSEYYGMHIIECSSSEIKGNVFTNDGLLVEEDSWAKYNSYAVENNIVNEKPLGFFIDLESATFNTPVHGQLILINCSEITLQNQNLNNTDIGLYLYLCNNIHISNSILSNSFKGMQMHQCAYIYAEYSDFENNTFEGVFASTSNQTYIEYCDLNGNERGIQAHSVPQITIRNNEFSLNELDGIYLKDCWYSVIEDNFVQFNGYSRKYGSVENGIKTENCRYADITNNELLYNGFLFLENSLSTYGTYNLTNNIVNTLPFGFFMNQVGLTISGTTYGQLFLVACLDITITNAYLYLASNALRMINCNDSRIDNVHSLAGQYGIWISDTTLFEISNCELNNNYNGLQLENCLYFNIHDNEIYNNTNNGAFFSNLDNSTIYQNSVYINDNFGLQFAASEFTNVTYNLLQENFYYGIFLAGCQENRIHHNTFFDNNLEGYDGGMITGYSQGYDTNTHSLWYDDTINEGNWWSNWGGVGSYSLDGGLINNEDPYPLGAPPVPVISEFNQRTASMVVFVVIVVPIILLSYRRKKK